MLRNDLEAAGIPYVTADGIADFHSLRHTFISNLAACGIHPKLAQQLARHSTIALTMDRYTHLGLIDMNSALESLPNIAAPESQTMRATGTTDDAPVLSCTKSCNAPAEITQFQPLSTAAVMPSAESPEMQKTPQKHEVFTEFSQARPAGLEPVTSGSTVRRGRVLTLRSRNELRSGVRAVLPTVTPTHRKTNAAKWSAGRFRVVRSRCRSRRIRSRPRWR